MRGVVWIVVGVVGLCFSFRCGGPSSGPHGPTNSSLSITPARGVLASPPSDLRFAVGSAPGSVAIADFNGDGKLDIVTANEQSGDASVPLGDGKGGFSPVPGSPFPAGRYANGDDIANDLWPLARRKMAKPIAGPQLVAAAAVL